MTLPSWLAIVVEFMCLLRTRCVCWMWIPFVFILEDFSVGVLRSECKDSGSRSSYHLRLWELVFSALRTRRVERLVCGGRQSFPKALLENVFRFNLFRSDFLEQRIVLYVLIVTLCWLLGLSNVRIVMGLIVFGIDGASGYDGHEEMQREREICMSVTQYCLVFCDSLWSSA